MKPPPELSQSVDWATQARRELHGTRERRAYLLFGAWAGAMLAAGAFGVMLFFWGVVVGAVDYSPLGSTTEVLAGLASLLMGCLAGFVLGSVWACVVGAGVVFICFVLLLALGVARLPTWVGSCIGAWIAFFCCGGFHWVPVVLGQVVAQYCGHRQVVNNPQRRFSEYDGPPTRQFRLARLLRYMTVACVVLAIVSLLPLEDRFRLQMAYCLAWQVGSILLVMGVRSVWAKRST